jgi:hypothetical protein
VVNEQDARNLPHDDTRTSLWAGRRVFPSQSPGGSAAPARATYPRSVDPFAAPPLVVGEQHGPQLGELLRLIFERRERDRPLVECEREQLHLVGAGAFELVAQLVGAGSPDEPGEVVDFSR